MNCISVSAYKVNNNLEVTAYSIIDSFEVTASAITFKLLSTVSAYKVDNNLKVIAYDITEKQIEDVICSSICAVAALYFLYFKEKSIKWQKKDNNEGFIKYNTLIASESWSLEEIEIEELL